MPENPNADTRPQPVTRSPFASDREVRWVCACKDPAVLLATYEPDGRLNIKVRDRFWQLVGFGQVKAVCPRCGKTHTLDLRQIRTTPRTHS